MSKLGTFHQTRLLRPASSWDLFFETHPVSRSELGEGFNKVPLSVRWLCKARGLFANFFFIRRQPYSGLWREMVKVSSLIGTETDIKANPNAYPSVRNVSTHSLLIRYRRVCVPALRLWGRTKTRANMMTEVIAALIAPLRLYTVNAGTSIHWCWKDIIAGHWKPVFASVIYF